MVISIVSTPIRIVLGRQKKKYEVLLDAKSDNWFKISGENIDSVGMINKSNSVLMPHNE